MPGNFNGENLIDRMKRRCADDNKDKQDNQADKCHAGGSVITHYPACQDDQTGAYCRDNSYNRHLENLAMGIPSLFSCHLFGG